MFQARACRNRGLRESIDLANLCYKLRNPTAFSFHPEVRDNGSLMSEEASQQVPAAQPPTSMQEES
jgi:hypothetical protein